MKNTDYNISEFKFFCGSFFDIKKYIYIDFRKNNPVIIYIKDIYLHYDFKNISLSECGVMKEIPLTSEEVKSFISDIRKFKVHSMKNYYEEILDGPEWEITVKLEKKTYVRYGNGSYPENFILFLEKYTKEKIL
ncbi:MAG TPA: hypothetical protein PLS66_00225 [Tepiditoga sp.]|nr:hypothetical protein [Thermotogota bacterium]HOO73692.1 hypothetical protein [Tepiditoga sp.]